MMILVSVTPAAVTVTYTVIFVWLVFSLFDGEGFRLLITGGRGVLKSKAIVNG